jgi:hypothetical protein
MVKARTPSIGARPFSTARAALARKSFICVIPPDWKAKRTPAAASRPAVFGASTRSRSTRRGSGSESGEAAAVRRGKFRESRTGTFAAFNLSATLCASVPPAMTSWKLNSLARSSARAICRSLSACITTGICLERTGKSAASDLSCSGRRRPRGLRS